MRGGVCTWVRGLSARRYRRVRNCAHCYTQEKDWHAALLTRTSELAAPTTGVISNITSGEAVLTLPERALSAKDTFRRCSSKGKGDLMSNTTSLPPRVAGLIPEPGPTPPTPVGLTPTADRVVLSPAAASATQPGASLPAPLVAGREALSNPASAQPLLLPLPMQAPGPPRCSRRSPSWAVLGAVPASASQSPSLRSRTTWYMQRESQTTYEHGGAPPPRRTHQLIHKQTHQRTHQLTNSTKEPHRLGSTNGRQKTQLSPPERPH